MLRLNGYLHDYIAFYKRFQKADYLTPTGIYEYVLEGSSAREVASFKTLFLPFDVFTWMYVIVATLLVAYLLFKIDKYWIRHLPRESKSFETNKYRGGGIYPVTYINICIII